MGQRVRLKWAGPMKSAANDREPGRRGVCRFSRRSPVLNPGYQHPNPGSLFERDLFAKPASTPHQVRGGLFPDHALDLWRSMIFFGKPMPTFPDHALRSARLLAFLSPKLPGEAANLRLRFTLTAQRRIACGPPIFLTERPRVAPISHNLRAAWFGSLRAGARGLGP